MKRKILFVMPHMGLGGAARALVSFLNMVSYDEYDIDLLLYHGRGFNLKYIPKEVNIIGPIMENNQYYKRFGILVKEQLKNGRIDVVLKKVYTISRTIMNHKNKASNDYWTWQFMKNYVPHLEKEYDCAVAYLDGTPHYYVIDKVRAKQKICWIHNDYSKFPTYKKAEHYLKKANIVATISPACVSSIKQCFPKLDNIKLVYNLNSSELIRKLANEFLPSEYNYDGRTTILSIGRLCEAKAYHLAIKAATILKSQGISFEWYIIGDGELRKELENLIVENNAMDYFHLLGLKENPYPYIKNANIIVQSSIYEGKSIALDEAKILCKPIVCTNYKSAKDQVTDRVNGLLVPISANGIANGIEKLIKDEDLVNSIKTTLKKVDYNQDKYLEEYIRLLNGVYNG